MTHPHYATFFSLSFDLCGRSVLCCPFFARSHSFVLNDDSELSGWTDRAGHRQSTCSSAACCCAFAQARSAPSRRRCSSSSRATAAPRSASRPRSAACSCATSRSLACRGTVPTGGGIGRQAVALRPTNGPRWARKGNTATSWAAAARKIPLADILDTPESSGSPLPGVWQSLEGKALSEKGSANAERTPGVAVGPRPPTHAPEEVGQPGLAGDSSDSASSGRWFRKKAECRFLTLKKCVFSNFIVLSC